ncbi:hypothetical protein DFA_01350 [Cavenderia fasciculata]|uniref:RNase III domain-containing protein n=1 Tax=Cavenderia fasciculata TaxID=261658 RepID=F4PS81_CACFS|nr:uncharacterized protein DFA_01350 [Cavenderia fasciculata]EGG21464.1 hypothetical protein DFA_01350 [Cavenderia fasciculata]|eukprot:XP_004359314.1 hypothetical protein DFA_01350 [Cavenderia fasciculata]
MSLSPVNKSQPKSCKVKPNRKKTGTLKASVNQEALVKLVPKKAGPPPPQPIVLVPPTSQSIVPIASMKKTKATTSMKPSKGSSSKPGLTTHKKKKVKSPSQPVLKAAAKVPPKLVKSSKPSRSTKKIDEAITLKASVNQALASPIPKMAGPPSQSTVVSSSKVSNASSPKNTVSLKSPSPQGSLGKPVTQQKKKKKTIRPPQPKATVPPVEALVKLVPSKNDAVSIALPIEALSPEEAWISKSLKMMADNGAFTSSLVPCSHSGKLEWDEFVGDRVLELYIALMMAKLVKDPSTYKVKDRADVMEAIIFQLYANGDKDPSSLDLLQLIMIYIFNKTVAKLKIDLPPKATGPSEEPVSLTRLFKKKEQVAIAETEQVITETKVSVPGPSEKEEPVIIAETKLRAPVSTEQVIITETKVSAADSTKQVIIVINEESHHQESTTPTAPIVGTFWKNISNVFQGFRNYFGIKVESI